MRISVRQGRGFSIRREILNVYVFRVVMRGSMMPVAVSAGCTITVKFNAKDGVVNDEDFSSTKDPCTGFACFWMSFEL